MSLKTVQRTQSAYDYPLIIKHLLHTPMIYAPKQEIVYRDLRRYDYLTFRKRVAQLANALQSLGVEPGSTVAVMDWDSHRYLECFFAIPMMGAILHTVNIRLSPEQILYTINHAEDDVILINSDFVPVLEGIKDQIETVKKLVRITDDESPSTQLEFAGEYEDLVGQSSDEFDFQDFDENTQATTFYTTGTTGLPKGVYFSHRQLVLHTFGILTATGSYRSHSSFDSGDVYMPITPMFHAHAWGFPYAATLVGAKQVYPGRYEPDTILRLISNEKVTFSHCVPTILHMLLNSKISKEVDLSGWKVIIGGSAMPKALCKSAMERGIDPFTGYGMSETCPILTLARVKQHMMDWEVDQQLEVRCRTGLPIPLVDLRIVDIMGEDMPKGEKITGEVVARTPWLTQGYFKDPKRSEELWSKGWLHTGDIGYLDSEGYLQVTDRIKDVIKTGGEWVSSLELEDIISQHEAVSETAVIGVPDDKWGERPLALVVLKEMHRDKVGPDDIKAFLMGHVEAGRMSKWGIPDKIILTEEIARTSVGKLDKKVLRRQYR